VGWRPRLSNGIVLEVFSSDDVAQAQAQPQVPDRCRTHRVLHSGDHAAGCCVFRDVRARVRGLPGAPRRLLMAYLRDMPIYHAWHIHVSQTYSVEGRGTPSPSFPTSVCRLGSTPLLHYYPQHSEELEGSSGRARASRALLVTLPLCMIEPPCLPMRRARTLHPDACGRWATVWPRWVHAW
jgi:hypothetical protein